MSKNNTPIDRSTNDARTGDDHMAATSNYVYHFIIKDEKKQLPALSPKKIEEFKAIVEKYLKKHD